MRPLLLIGAGAYGREVAALVRHVNRTTPTWDLLGFLDEDAHRHGECVGKLSVLGGLEALAAHPDAVCLCCVAEPVRRMRLAARAEQFGARWATLIHPAAVVLDSARIGEGCVLFACSAATVDVALGRHVHLDYHTIVSHDAKVGDFSWLSPCVDVTGNVTVETGVFLGSGACVLPGLHVGAHAIVAAGALVNRDVAARAVVAGVPARVVAERGADLSREDLVRYGVLPPVFGGDRAIRSGVSEAEAA